MLHSFGLRWTPLLPRVRLTWHLQGRSHLSGGGRGTQRAGGFLLCQLDARTTVKSQESTLVLRRECEKTIPGWDTEEI